MFASLVVGSAKLKIHPKLCDMMAYWYGIQETHEFAWISHVPSSWCFLFVPPTANAQLWIHWLPLWGRGCRESGSYWDSYHEKGALRWFGAASLSSSGFCWRSGWWTNSDITPRLPPRHPILNTAVSEGNSMICKLELFVVLHAVEWHYVMYSEWCQSVQIFLWNILQRIIYLILSTFQQTKDKIWIWKESSFP